MRSIQWRCIDLALALLFFSLGCGGGSTPLAPTQPPVALTYTTNPAVYTKGITITANTPANVSGVVTSYSVTPSLPVGLSLSTTTGVLSGTPTATSGPNGYTVVGSNPGGSTTCTLTITVAPTPLASIAKATGDDQTAPPGTAVSIAPDVVVIDALGAPAVDIEVTFAITSGGGSVQSLYARTDGSGHASCGTWRLGAAKGLNTLSASVAGLTPVTFTAKAANKSADVSISVMTPRPGSTVDDPLSVVASISSTYQLSTVTASTNGSSIRLAYGSCFVGRQQVEAWNGLLSLTGQPRGIVSVVVTATDVFSNSTDTIIAITFDRYPAVAVTAPFEGSVARPLIKLEAACTDDDPAGPTSLTATLYGPGAGSAGTVVASGKNVISQQVDLSAYEGQSMTLVFSGVDSIRQTRELTRTIYVESSTRLSVKAEVNGKVWDVSDTRILFLDSSEATPSLKILDTASGVTETVETTANLVGTWGCYGYLTPTGAIYVRGANPPLASPYSWLFEWRDGALSNLAGLDSADSLRVAGNWAVYNTPALWSRDLRTGVSTFLSASAANWMNDVASNGDIAYWTSADQIYLWRNGSTLTLTNDTQWNIYPVTDGVNAVYRKYDGSQGYRIAMHNGSTETILTAAMTTEPRPGSSYAVAGGHIAYAVEDIAKACQIWRHDPGGEQQLTFFGTSSTIDGIGPDGTILLTHSPNQYQAARRYQAAPGLALQEIGSGLGRVIFRDGKFLVLLGRSVLEVGP